MWVANRNVNPVHADHFDRSTFVYCQDTDSWHCPNDCTLIRKQMNKGSIIYAANPIVGLKPVFVRILSTVGKEKSKKIPQTSWGILYPTSDKEF